MQLPYIFQAIDLLIKNNICDLHEDELFCKLPANWAATDYGDFTSSAIKESQGYTDRQFLTEVINIA